MLDSEGYDPSINSSLPKEWFEEAEGATIFGVPILEYSFEEVCAIAAHGWKMFQGNK
jgi:hypothetical protein